LLNPVLIKVDTLSISLTELQFKERSHRFFLAAGVFFNCTRWRQ